MNRKSMFRALLVAALLLPGLLLTAQQVTSSTSKKAIKHYQKGYEHIRNRQFTDAIHYAKMAIQEDVSFTEAYIMVAESYSMMEESDLALIYYQKALYVDPDFSPQLYYFTAREYMRSNHYNEALAFFVQYFEKAGTEKGKVSADIRMHYDQCVYRAKLMTDSSHIQLTNMGPNINSVLDEYQPSFTADESCIIFTLLRPADLRTECKGCTTEEDLYVSRQENGEWLPRKPLGEPINSHYNEGAQCISPDGKYVLFTACHREDGYGSCDLYWSKRVGDRWTVPQNMGKPVNTQYWESQPTFGADGKTIYYASNRPGGKGKCDIWKTTMIEDGVFSTPVNVGEPINTAADELAPYLHPNGTVLYFASTGHPGMGGQDLFYSLQNSDGTWNTPVNMGYPINTSADESNIVVNAKGTRGYIASNKKGGFGKMDIYWFELPEKMRPQPVTYLKGRIFNAKDSSALCARFKVMNLVTGADMVMSESDPESGEFLVCIPSNGSYALHASHPDFLFYSANFTLDSSYQLKPYHKDIYMNPIEAGRTVVLNNVFFDTDKSVLRKESELELSKLVELMKSNPKLRVEIGGHTDNQGSREHNLTLSRNRAKAVYDYLVSQGVKADRMRYKGYGFEQPVAENDTPEGRSLNRRTEFKIMGN